jgi:hypothetical protein
VFKSGFEEAKVAELSSDLNDSTQHCWEAGSDSDLSDSDVDYDTVNVDDVAASDLESMAISTLPTGRTRRIVHIHDTA